MPDLDLKSRKEPGRLWHLCWLAVGLLMLAGVWWYREQVTPDALFLATAVLAAACGGMLYGAFKDVY